MAKIGGIAASVMPIVGRFGPFFVLAFLISVARIIKNRIDSNFKTRVKSFINLSCKQFGNIIISNASK